MLFASRHMRVSRTEHICSKSLTLSHRAVVFFSLWHTTSRRQSHVEYTNIRNTLLTVIRSLLSAKCEHTFLRFASSLLRCASSPATHMLFFSLFLSPYLVACRFHSIQCVMCVSCRYRYISTVPYVMPIDQYLLRHLYTVYFQFNVIIIFCSCMLMLLPISIFFYSLITC